MATINSQLYELLRTYQRELNVREPSERTSSIKEIQPFSKVLESVAGTGATEATKPVSPSHPSDQPGDEPDESGQILRNLNYDPHGYISRNQRGVKSIVDFFQ